MVKDAARFRESADADNVRFRDCSNNRLKRAIEPLTPDTMRGQPLVSRTLSDARLVNVSNLKRVMDLKVYRRGGL